MVPKQHEVNIGQSALEQGSLMNMLRQQPPWSCWEGHVEFCPTEKGRVPNLEPGRQGWNPVLATPGCWILSTWLTKPQFHQHCNKNNTYFVVLLLPLLLAFFRTMSGIYSKCSINVNYTQGYARGIHKQKMSVLTPKSGCRGEYSFPSTTFPYLRRIQLYFY